MRARSVLRLRFAGDVGGGFTEVIEDGVVVALPVLEEEAVEDGPAACTVADDDDDVDDDG